MQYGILMFPTDEAVNPSRLAVACEERGFESLWFPEHTHIPTSHALPPAPEAVVLPLLDKYHAFVDSMALSK